MSGAWVDSELRPEQIIGQIDPNASTLNQILNMPDSAIAHLLVGESPYHAPLCARHNNTRFRWIMRFNTAPAQMPSQESDRIAGDAFSRSYPLVGLGVPDAGA